MGVVRLNVEDDWLPGPSWSLKSNVLEPFPPTTWGSMTIDAGNWKAGTVWLICWLQ